MAIPHWTVWFHWRDRGGSRAQSQIRLPSSLSAGQAGAAALQYAALLLTVSDAIIEKVSVWKAVDMNEGVMPPIGADVSRIGLLFYKNSGGVYESLAVPSIRMELLETSGPFAGVRLIASDVAGGSVFLDLESALSQTLTDEGLPWDYLHINGGLML